MKRSTLTTFATSGFSWLGLLYATLSVTACAQVVGIEEPNSDVCHRYCDLISAQCEGDSVIQFLGHSEKTKVDQEGNALTPYEQQRHCLAYCDLMLSNEDKTKPLGNTIACRVVVLDSQEQAASRPEKCEDAGPASKVCSNVAGAKGDPVVDVEKVCSNYCELHSAVCTEFLVADPNCLADCKANYNIPVGPGTYTIGSVGNTLNCRIYHTSVSLIEGPLVHCGHGAKASTMNACVEP